MHVKNYINNIYGTFEANVFFTSLYSLQKGKIWCIHAIQCVYVVQKTHYFPHSVHYCCSTFLKRVDFLQSSSFWEARCAMIGQIYSALWLAEYLKRVMEMLCPLPCCDAVSRRDETKTIKPTIHEAFVAFSEDIITYYNDSFCLFTGFAALHKHNAMSAFVIVETPNKHYTTLHSSKLVFE